MKKRIVELVEKRLAVFKMKQTHNRYMEMSTFIFEVTILYIVLFCLILLVGSIGSLNTEFNYVFYMSNSIIILTYFFIRYLHETRYQNHAKIAYNIMPVIIVELVSLVVALIIGNSFLGLMTFGENLNTLNLIVVGSFSVFGLLLGGIFILLMDQIEGEKRFLNVIATGVIIGIFHLLFYFIAGDFFTPALLVLDYLLIIVLLVTKEIIQQKPETRSIRLYFTLTSFVLIVLYTVSVPVNDVIEATGSDNMIDDFQMVVDLEEEVISNVVSDQSYIYFSVLHNNGSSYKIYDKEFNYIAETDVLIGQNYMFSEQGIFTVQTRTIDNYVEYMSMYQLNDDYSFELLFEEPLNNIFRSSVVFEYEGNSLILIQYDGLGEVGIFKVVDQRLEEIDSLPEGIIYQSDTTLVENGEAGLIALSNFGPEYRFFDFTQTDDFIRYSGYDNGYVMIREDMSFYTIKNTHGNVLIERVDLGDIYADFDIVNDELYFYDYFISKTFEAQINKICKLNLETSTCTLYGFNNFVFRVDDEFFQIYDRKVYVLNDSFGLNVVDTRNVSINTALYFMMIPCLLLVTFDVKNFIYVEVESNVS